MFCSILIDCYLEIGHFKLWRYAIFKPRHIEYYFFLIYSPTAGLQFSWFISNNQGNNHSLIPPPSDPCPPLPPYGGEGLVTPKPKSVWPAQKRDLFYDEDNKSLNMYKLKSEFTWELLFIPTLKILNLLSDLQVACFLKQMIIDRRKYIHASFESKPETRNLTQCVINAVGLSGTGNCESGIHFFKRTLRIGWGSNDLSFLKSKQFVNAHSS